MVMMMLLLFSFFLSYLHVVSLLASQQTALLIQTHGRTKYSYCYDPRKTWSLHRQGNEM